MATIILTFGGFANFPASPPASWPANLTWPANASPNGSSTLTMNDADFQAMLSWVANNRNSQITGPPPFTPPIAVTTSQLRTQWLNIWTTGSISATQQQNITPAALPAPITISVS